MNDSRLRKARILVCFVLATAMYYSAERGFQFGVGIKYKHLFAVALVILGGCVFLVDTDLLRARRMVSYASMLMLPNLVVLAVSIPLWISQLRTFEEMRGGLFSQIYQFIIISAMASMAYMLGKRSIWINLAAMLSANAVTFVSTISAYGLGQYLKELCELIISFSDDTGSAIANMELHELTFALGVYLVFLVLEWRRLPKSAWVIVMTFLTLFFFISGFKRIGILGVALGILAGVVMRPIVGKRRLKWLWFFGVAVTAAMVIYVWIIDSGFLNFVEQRWGISLMGRDSLLELVDGLYHFGPDFMGHGVGYLQEYIVGIVGKGLHNDIVTMYVDIGFWGLILWGIALFPIRAAFLAKHEGKRAAILSLTYGIYWVVTALTDNTFVSYVYITAAVSLLIMAGQSEETSPKIDEG